MRRIAVLFAAAALLAAPAGSAFATVHPISCSEQSSANAAVPAANQNPPGITQPPHEDPGPDQSQATTAQPLISISSNSTATLNSFKPEGCTAP